MSELDRERCEIAATLQQPGLGPDPKLRITRRTFVHRSCVAGAATVAQTFGWWPLINTIDMAYAAEPPFKFAWISDTHLYPESVNEHVVFISLSVNRDRAEGGVLYLHGLILVSNSSVGNHLPSPILSLRSMAVHLNHVKAAFESPNHTWRATKANSTILLRAARSVASRA